VLSSRTEYFSGIWGSSAQDIFAVGGNILHFDGIEWSCLSDINPHVVAGLWGDSGDDVYVVGGGGLVLHYGNSQLTQPPAISSFTPECGAAGTQLTINGMNFTGAGVVSIGNTPTAGFTVDSPTRITAKAGNGATGKITVITPGGTATSTASYVVFMASSTMVTTSSTQSVFGQSVTFAATVSELSPGNGTPTGTVTFMDGDTILGTDDLNNSGQATYNMSTLSVGSHSISAVYNGDAIYATSISSIVTQQVMAHGDANGDGTINMADVTKVERMILTLDPLTPWADANNDGVTTMGDVTKIERIILGLK
jgi:hypothetical protein